MRTRILFAGMCAALMAAPFIASAASIGDLQAEIASLLGQIQGLQAQGSASTSVSVGAAPAAAMTMPLCPSFTRSLSVGSRGDDVSQLQQFLETKGYLNVSATGYFGPLTAAAVGRWQAQSGVASAGSGGFGMFGPMSRSYFSRYCGQAQQPFSADPQSGAAPLDVTFTTSDSVVSSSTYSVDFGDSTTGSMTKGECVGITAIVGGQGGIRCSFIVDHTYSANGTYTAKLLKQTPFSCPGNLMCAQSEAMILRVPQVVGTATITVGTSTTASTNFTASPTSGAAPLTVQFASTAPQGAQLGTTVNFGDGTNGTLGFVPVCSSCNAEGIVSHTYTAPGTYTATLTGGMCSCPAGGICNCPNMMVLGTATVTVTGATSTPASSIQRLNAPGSVTLQTGGIAEIRNESSYFTLQSLTASTATIQITPVGCWNSFPSDTPPAIRCMIATVLIPPQTLSVGQAYAAANYGITLTQLNGASATFSINASSATGY